MPHFLIYILFLVLIVIAIYYRYHNERLYAFTKPLPIILLLSLYWFLPQIGKFPQMVLFIFIGLVFGLLGDVFLLRKKWFLLGLVAFLIGHFFYILAWWPTQLVLPWPAYFFFIVGATYFLFLRKGLIKNNKKHYIIPSLFYVVFISLMFLFSLNFFLLAHSTHQHILISVYFLVGAGLFCISDSILAFDRFVQPFPLAQFAILTTYYIGQGVITLGALRFIL